MENILNDKIVEMIHALGKEIKEDPRASALQTAADTYNESVELRTLITEYNVHQTALSAEFGKEEREEAVIHSIQNRINELYELITHNDSYQNFVRAKEESDAFVKMVNAELEFFITGHRSCSHDCSSCHADCSGAQKHEEH